MFIYFKYIYIILNITIFFEKMNLNFIILISLMYYPKNVVSDRLIYWAIPEKTIFLRQSHNSIM